MGSKSGKYTMKDGEKTSASVPSDTDLWTEGSRSKSSKSSFPVLIHKSPRADASLSTNRNNTSLVWLDAELNSQPSTVDTQIKLKNVISYLRTFVEANACERYVEQIGQMNTTGLLNEEKLLVIISPAFALTIIPRFHNLPQVKSMYVYGTGKIAAEVNEQLLKRFPKVKGVYSTSQSLLTRIVEDQQR